MEDKIIFEEENIIEQNLEHWKTEEEKESQKEQNTSQETSQYEKSPDKEDILNKIENERWEKQQQNKKINDKEISSYILNYTRNEIELNKIPLDTGIKKAEKCSFKLDIKLIPGSANTKNNETLLVFYCHEIAAFSFDEIYERIYTIKDLCGENRYFKVFENNEDAKTFIDEFIKINEKNSNKFFIEFKDNTLKIHLKFSFFDKEKEIIFNIPKKNLDIKEKNILLPEFLKEIQVKMYNLCKENKKLKTKSLTLNNNTNKIKKLKIDLKDNNNIVNEFSESNDSNKSCDNVHKTDILETNENMFMNKSFNTNHLHSNKLLKKKGKKVKKIIKKKNKE